MAERILSVSELNNYIKRVIENNSVLRRVTLEGEISNMTRASSGHYYFSLKDEDSEVRCIMWRSKAERIKVKPENGLAVVVKGNVEVYAQRGNYSVIVSNLKPAGIGYLYELYLKRYESLKELGYFDLLSKQKLPENIETVGVVTSETGAVLHDIITTIRRRNPLIKIVLAPALVQGEEASESIASGIRALNNEGSSDVIIVGRGGGSMEDLWAFNELEVADAIYHSQIPIISAVGHETDVTIADHVADLRAPTPTAAAEYVSNGLILLEEKLSEFETRMTRALVDKYNALNHKIEVLTLHLLRLSPERVLRESQYRIDELERRMVFREFQILEKNKNRIDSLKTKLELLNPTELFKRGYSMVTSTDGKVVDSTKEALSQREVVLHFADGKVLAETEKELKDE